MAISGGFKRIATKNKRKNHSKTVGINVDTMLINVLTIFLGLRSLTERHAEVVRENYLLRSEIAYSNIDCTTWGSEANSEFTGIFYSYRSKNIDGTSVSFEEYQGNYSIASPMSTGQGGGLKERGSNSSDYTHGSLYKVSIFCNANAPTRAINVEVIQDISKVIEITGQVVEVIITFDKPYTYQEATDMVPDNLLINWYRIGTSNIVDTVNSVLDVKLGFALSSINGHTTDFKDSKPNLKRAIELGVIDSRHSIENETLSLGDDAKVCLKNNLNYKTATFSGAILTGCAENFVQLEDRDWVYASNIGQSITIQPYRTLTK